MAWTPEPPPLSDKELRSYVYRQFQELAGTLQAGVDAVILTELNVAPTKPRSGMVVLADGTNWNPGSGAGYYGYRGGAWHFLG